MWSDVSLSDGRTLIRSFLQENIKKAICSCECQSSSQNATPEQLICSSWPVINVIPNNQIKVWCKCQTNFFINSITRNPSAWQLTTCNASLILQNRRGYKRYLTFTWTMNFWSTLPLRCSVMVILEAAQFNSRDRWLFFVCIHLFHLFLSARTLRQSWNNRFWFNLGLKMPLLISIN